MANKTEIVKLRKSSSNGNCYLTVPFALKDELPEAVHYRFQVINGMYTYTPIKEV